MKSIDVKKGNKGKKLDMSKVNRLCKRVDKWCGQQQQQKEADRNDTESSIYPGKQFTIKRKSVYSALTTANW